MFKEERGINMLKKCVIQLADKNKQAILGAAGAGKSRLAQMIATEKGYLYFSDEHSNWRYKPMKCAEFLAELQSSGEEIKGIVFDATDMKRHLTDWDTYEWSLPIYYTQQTNRDALSEVLECQKS